MWRIKRVLCANICALANGSPVHSMLACSKFQKSLMKFFEQSFKDPAFTHGRVRALRPSSSVNQRPDVDFVHLHCCHASRAAGTTRAWLLSKGKLEEVSPWALSWVMITWKPKWGLELEWTLWLNYMALQAPLTWWALWWEALSLIWRGAVKRMWNHLHKMLALISLKEMICQRAFDYLKAVTWARHLGNWACDVGLVSPLCILMIMCCKDLVSL